MRIQAACWAFSSGVFGALPMLGFLSCITQDAVKYEVACAHKRNNHYSYIYIYTIYYVAISCLASILYTSRMATTTIATTIAIYIHHILCGHFMLSQHSIYQSHGYNNNCNNTATVLGRGKHRRQAHCLLALLSSLLPHTRVRGLALLRGRLPRRTLALLRGSLPRHILALLRLVSLFTVHSWAFKKLRACTAQSSPSNVLRSCCSRSSPLGSTCMGAGPLAGEAWVCSNLLGIRAVWGSAPTCFSGVAAISASSYIIRDKVHPQSQFLIQFKIYSHIGIRTYIYIYVIIITADLSI